MNNYKLSDCFVEEGYDAYQEGVDISDCPYPEGTDGEFGWRKGWHMAERVAKGE